MVQPDQGFVVRGLATPPVASDAAENMIAVWAGADVQLGSVPLAQYVTRVDDPLVGTTFEFSQSGIYLVAFYAVLPFDGTSGLMPGVSLDAAPALRSNANPEPWEPLVVGSDAWFNWPADTSVAFLIARGVMHVTPTQAATPGLGVMRCHLSDSNNGPVTEFSLNAANCTLRLRRTADGGA